MKGILLKDFYMLKKYCKAYLLIAAVFIAASLMSDENMFFVSYPCLFCSMIPVNLLGYDERSHFLQYSGTLPYTKTQIVSAKYLMGLFAQIAILIATGIAQAVRMGMNGTFVLGDYLMLMFMVFIMAAISSSISLPFMFKWGVEKGRIAYYVTIGVVCAGSVIASNLVTEEVHSDRQTNGVLLLLCLAGIGVYALSWYLSVVFYKKREIN